MVKQLPLGGKAADKGPENEFEALKRKIHGKLVDKLDLTKVSEMDNDVLRREIRMVVEHLSIMPATGGPAAYPDGWFEKFAWKTEPAKVKEWPALAEVKAQLRSQLSRLQEAIRALSPAQLDAIADPAKGRSLRYSILHGLHDEAGHQGEMYLLRKLYARRTAAANVGS